MAVMATLRREHRKMTGADLSRLVRRMRVSEATPDAIDEQVVGRRG